MELLRQTALQYIGTPYIYAGNHVLEGFDCSGFVQELLMSVGVDPRWDQSSQGLYDHFSEAGEAEWNNYSCGALAFFGDSASKIEHVAMLLDQYRMIEAAGGDSTTKTFDDAKARGACVRIRPVASRRDLVAILKPRYNTIGYS